MAYSFRSIVDGGSDSDMIYYNATLTATKTSDLFSSSVQSPIRFNESRDAPIIRDASQYYFSIIRFAMNGPGKNLPLFIPLIQTNGNIFSPQLNVNQTVYYVSLAYQREWNYTDSTGAAQTIMITLTPHSVAIQYIPETQDTRIAPVPVAPAGGITKQDLSTRYYWIYTYKHFVQLVNNAFYTAMENLWTDFNAAWSAQVTVQGSPTATPYPTFADFLADQDIPYIYYDEVTGLFEIYGDTRCFNVSGQMPLTPLGTNGIQDPLPAFVPAAYAPADPASPASACYIRLFFNDLLFGLLSNFNNTYLGASNGGSIVMPLTQSVLTPLPPLNLAFESAIIYSNEILFTNQQYKNILNNNPTLQGLNAVPPPVYNPFFFLPAQKQNLYWIAKQDYRSTDTMWSPVANIVFTSSLIPLKKEFNAAPVELNQTNVSGKSVPAQSSFEPIICDFVIDQQIESAQGWRSFALYEPTAEYRLLSMQASHEEIRNIDIQCWWRYRLTGELIPLTMANASDVSIKMLFRKVDFRS
jgi:hypothetical protein